MPYVQELVSDRSGTLRQVSRRYLAVDYPSESAAISAVIADSGTPSTVNSLLINSNSCQAEEFDADQWYVTIVWGVPGGTVVSSGLNYNFQIGGTSIFREYAISTAKYPATAPDAGNAINYDGERVNGVSLPQQSGFEFVIPAIKPSADVDQAYVQAVADLYLTVNDATFEGFPAGEVLFLGLSGSRTGAGDWQLYYRFARSDNLAGITVDGVAVTSKEGWEYLWIRYKPKEDANGWQAAEPAGVYVQQVFVDGDFSGLEL